jgi:hypothetical protein
LEKRLDAAEVQSVEANETLRDVKESYVRIEQKLNNVENLGTQMDQEIYNASSELREDLESHT